MVEGIRPSGSLKVGEDYLSCPLLCSRSLRRRRGFRRRSLDMNTLRGRSHIRLRPLGTEMLPASC